MEKSRVYILTDDENRITRLEGEYTLPSDLDGWILVEEGEPCDRLNLAQTHYLQKTIFEDHGIPQYKWDGTEIIERTEEEIEADIALIPLPEPTDMEQLRADVDYLLMLED